MPALTMMRRCSDFFDDLCLADHEIAKQLYAQRYRAAKGVQCIEGEPRKRNPGRECDKRAGLQFLRDQTSQKIGRA